MADGGTLQFQGESNGYLISVFSSPVPLRVGAADLSVLVQQSANHSDVLNAQVLIHVSRIESGEIREIAVPATHSKATNKLLYAAPVTFPGPAEWKTVVDVEANGSTASVSGTLHVLPAQAPAAEYWPFFVAIPVIIVLFGINQWLRRRRQIRRAPP
jgi:hypothetical protein